MKTNFTFIVLMAVSLILPMNNNVMAQDEDEFEIIKCVRFEAGIVYAKGFYHAPKNDQGYRISYAYGIKPASRLGIGLGTDINLFENETIVPVYLNTLLFLREKKSTLYLDLKAGYSLVWTKTSFTDYETYNYKGGPSFTAGIGRRFAINEKFCFSLKAAYTSQFAKVDFNYPGERTTSEKLQYNLFSLSFGLMLEQK